MIDSRTRQIVRYRYEWSEPIMMQVTATDFKTNFGKYLSLVSEEEIQITKNGVAIAILIPPMPRPSVVDELVGVIPDDGYGVKQSREDRRLAHESNG